jgi:hypothetical protein
MTGGPGAKGAPPPSTERSALQAKTCYLGSGSWNVAHYSIG